MAFEITIPRLGWSMEEGTFVRWLKKDGDFIRPGDTVFELEGEKAAQDIEAVDSGILKIPASAPPPGTVVKVGAVIGYLVAEGESVPSGTSAAGNAAAIASRPAAPIPVVEPLAKAELPPPAAAPSVRRLAREMKVNLASVAGTGPAGRITADDIRSTSVMPQDLGNSHSVFSSPRARRVAKELGINWHAVPGTGRNGRVRETDVRHAATNGGSRVSVPATSIAGISSLRRTIAKRMEASRDRTVPVTLTTRIDASNLVGLRNQFKQSANGNAIPSYTDIVIKLVALVLPQHPMLAVREEGDRWITPASPNDLHIGLAVDTDAGLLVPVIRDVHNLGLIELSKQSANLVAKARHGKLSVAEMQNAVFTVTNLGAFGIDGFTPIINLPETAVLGLGRIRPEPTVISDRVEIREQLTLSLTFDHRIVDGAPAARFLQTVSNAIETPSAWLLRSIG